MRNDNGCHQYDIPNGRKLNLNAREMEIQKLDYKKIHEASRHQMNNRNYKYEYSTATNQNSVYKYQNLAPHAAYPPHSNSDSLMDTLFLRIRTLEEKYEIIEQKLD